MNRLRVATPEEVAKIQANSDITPNCIILALDTQAGPAFAVVRQAVEVDPIHFPEGASDKMKAFFLRDIETFLTAKGVDAFYFNILTTDEAWQNYVKHWGAEQLSTAPEFRFKRLL